MSASEVRSGKEKLQILVVDDEPIVRHSIKLLLEYYGHEVSGAENGEDALAHLAQRKCDLVITDFFMPGMCGDELITRIRQLSPEQPIVLVSGSLPESRLEPLLNQMNAYLQKPFSLEQLRTAVDRALRRPGIWK